MPKNKDRQRRPQQQQRQDRRPPQDERRQQPPAEPSPLRKKKSNGVLIAVIVLALIAVVALAILVLPGACSRMQDDGNGEINVTNTEGSLLSEEQLIDRAKERYAGTWVISSVTWQGEEGDGTSIPQKVAINVDGTCTLTQGGTDYTGKWEVDGDSLYVTAKAGKEEIIKVLSIDDASLNINSNNGTGVYVRTSKPKVEPTASDAEE